MEKNSFWRTKAGGLTIAFLVIMAAFAVIVAGIYTSSEVACTAGFVMIVAAMLYSPVRTYIIRR